MQEALTMMRAGNLGVSVTAVLAEKYNTSERKARDCVAEARKLLDQETADLAETWRSEILMGTAEAYRLACARKNVALMLQASAQLWRMTGNEKLLQEPPRTPQQLDLTRLTMAERQQLREIMVKALPPPTIDVTPPEDE